MGAVIRATPEGMMVAYGSLVIMALIPIYLGSFRSVESQKAQKENHVSFIRIQFLDAIESLDLGYESRRVNLHKPNKGIISMQIRRPFKADLKKVIRNHLDIKLSFCITAITSFFAFTSPQKPNYKEFRHFYYIKIEDNYQALHLSQSTAF